MLTVSIIVSILLLCFFLFNINNGINKIIAIYLLDIVLLGFVGILYASKVTNYPYIFAFDYNIYLWVSKIKIYISTLSRLYNMAIALFMYTSVLFFIYSFKKRILKCILFAIPVSIFVVINDISVKGYIKISALQNSGYGFADFVFEFIRSYSIWLFVIYMLIPLVWSIYSYFKDRRMLNKRYTIALFTSVFALDIFVYYVFLSGNVSPVIVFSDNTSGVPVMNTTQNTFLSFMMIISIFIVLIMVLSWYFRPLIFLSKGKKNRILRTSQNIEANTSLLFHEIKNMVITAGFQTKLAERNAQKPENKEEMLKNIKKANEITEQCVEYINSKILYFNNSSSNNFDVNMRECLNDALSEANCETVKIETNYPSNDVTVFGNRSNLKECFKNMIINSIASFDNIKREDPIVKVTLTNNDTYCCVEIADNGEGIDKRDMKHIFNSFYSTKDKTEASGIGLAYVKKVVDAHNGTVYVNSKKNKGTVFQVVLPVRR